MKKILLLGLMGLMGLWGFQAQGQTVCPEGYSTVDTMLNGSSNNANTPFGSSKYYHVTWSIYSRQELEAIGITPGSQLREIGYSLYSTDGHTVYNVEIYLKEVPLQAIATVADSVPLSEMTLVSSIAQVDFVHGWNYLTLDSTFTYTGYGHLMVAVKREGTASGVTMYTSNFTVMAGKTVRRYRSTQNTYNTVNSLYAVRAAIAFRTCTPPWDCTAPAIASLRSEGNSVQVVIDGGAAERQVALVPTGGSPDDSTALWVNATGDTVLVDSLDSWTTYDVYARSLCGGFPSQWSTPQSVKTHCGVQPVPYDAYLTQANTDSCWVLYNVLLYSNYVYSNDSTTFSYAVLPEMDLPINRLHVQFRYTLQAGRSMVLGVMTDAYDTTTFIPYDTLTAEYNRNNDFYDFDFNRWTGPEGRLAFRWTMGQLRRVQVDTVFGCYTPSAFTVSDVTTTSARLAWNNRSTSVTGYEVELAEGTQYFNPTLFSTDSMGMVLDSLQPNTYYSVQVRTRCGEGNTVGPDGVSQWSSWKQFCTECVTVNSLPYRLTSSQLGLPDGTNFAAPCWEYVPDVSGFSYWVLPEFDTNNIRMDQLKITLSLRYNSDAPDVIGLGVVDGVSTLSSNFAQIGQISMPGVSNYNVSTGKCVFYCNLRQGKRLAFRMLGNKIQTIDSIVVEQMACPPVRDIVLTASTDTSMTFNWTEQGTATQWMVSLTSQDGSYQQSFIATGRPFTVGDLTVYTKYRVEVRALNYGDTSEVCQKWLHTSPDALHTLVQVGVGDGSASTSSGSFNYPVYRSSKHSWQQMLYPLSTQGKAGWIDTVWFYCKSRYNSNDAHDTSLTLYLGHADTTVARNIYDWVPMAGLTQVYHTDNWRASATGWVPIVLDTPFLYNGTDALAVVFSHSAENGRSNGDQYAYLSMSNGVTMHSHGIVPVFATHPGYHSGTRESTLPVARFSMMAHTCAPVANMAATRSGLDTVQLSWTERGTASQWQVEYSDDSIWLGDTIIIGTPQLTFAGLALDHTYRFRVRPVCAAGDTGYYSGYATLALNTPLPPVDTLTVTSTSLSVHPEVPIGGVYADYGFLDEFIYPASMLAGMEGSVIHGVQFHYSMPSVILEETFTLAMQEVSDSTCTIAGWRHDSTALQVWTGSITIEDSLWTVWFDSPFTYGGGHLLFRSATDGLTGGNYLGYGFQCLNAGDTAGRYQYANAQHQLVDSLIFTTPYLPVIDFFYTSDSNFCHRPLHLVADSVWGTGAAMSWDSMPGAMGYQWTLTNGGQTVDSGTTTATTVSVGGLTFFDTYTFGVSTLCDSGDVSGATTVTFFTPMDCSALTLPYHEDFEAVAPAAYNVAGNLPDCWESFNNSAFTYLAPHVITTGSYNYISDIPDHALLMMSSGSSSSASGHTSTALLPRFAGGLGSLALVLDHRHENAMHGTLTVGYYDEALDTFHPVDTLTPQVGSYRRDTVSFSTVTDTSVRMALQWTDSYTTFWGVAIDNIEVYTNDAPQQLIVIAVTPQCVSLRWAATDSATAYVVGLAGLGDTVVSDTTVTLCGLAEGTDYTVGVSAIMGSDTGHYAHASFHTPQLCAPVLSASVEVDGNNIVVGWQYDTTGYSAATGAVVTLTDLENGSVRIDTVLGVTTALYAGTAYHRYAVGVQTLCGTAISGSNMDTVQMPASVCYQIRGTRSENYRFINGYSSYNYNQMLYPATAVGSVDTLYGIAFRVSGQTSTYTRATDIYLGHTTATTLASPVSADSLTQVADNYPYSIADTGWSRIMFDTPFVYDGSSNLIVTMVDVSGFDAPYNPGTGMHAPQTGEAYLYYSKVYQSEPTPDPYTLNFTAYTYSWIPDIRLLGGCNYGQCLSPEPMVTSTGVSSITLTWTERGIEDLWQVEYRSDASDPWTVAGTTGATTYTLAGLAPATVYQLRVASLCSGDTLHSYILTSHTACDTVQLPYHADFTLGTQPCWIEGGYYGDSFSGIRLYGLPSYYPRDSIVSPVIGGSLSDVKVTIRAQNPNNDSYYSNNSASLAVGACNADGSGIVWVDTVDFNERQVVEEHTVHFSHYSGTARNIIIRVLGAIANVESVSIDLFSGCLPVHDVRIAGLTDSEATVQWMPEDASHSFAVYLDGTLQGIASGTNYVLTGLAADSQYTATVREICTAGDTAEAIACTFRTACTALSLPVFEDFDYAAIYDEAPGLPDCWTSLFYDHTATAYGIYSDGYYTCMHLNTSDYADSTVGNFAVSPLMNVGPGGATVRFKGQTGWTGPVAVGVMTNVSDTATFIPCLTVTHNNYGLQWYQFNTDTLALPDVWAFAVRFGSNRTGIFDSLYVEVNPVPTYSLSLAVNDTAMGSVSGAGTYEEGTMVTVTATPNPGYRFVVWSDSVTSATRQITLRNSDISLTAYFEPVPQYTVTVNAVMNNGSQQDGLDEMVHGAGTYMDGDTVTLEGEEHGCATSFVYWITTEGDTLFDNPYTFIIHSDVTLTAVFAIFGGIDDVEGTTFTLHPNPAHDEVTVSVSQPSTLTVLDMAGRVVIPATPVTSELRIPTSEFPAGVYFVRIGEGVKKLIVR